MVFLPIPIRTSRLYFIAAPPSPLLNVGPNAKWRQDGVTVAGGNGSGRIFSQLSHPFEVCIDNDKTIYIADLENDRIVEWKSDEMSGQVIAGGNGEGDRLDQLNSPADVIIDRETDSLIICDWQNHRVVQWPRRDGTTGRTIISDIKCRGLAMDKSGFLYVSNWRKNEVRRWRVGETHGTIVAGGNGEGDRLDQLSYPTHLFVDQNNSVYVSDWNNHRVMKWEESAKEGIVVAGGQGQGDASTQLSHPGGVIVDHLATVYVADCDNHRVMGWPKGATQGHIVVGGNGQGGGTNQFSFPMCLTFDQHDSLYVVDEENHRVQRFSIDHH